MLSGISCALLYCAAKVECSFLNPTSGQVVKSVGTGFFIQNATGSVCFVTNRHVIDRSYNPEDPLAPKVYQLRDMVVSCFFAETGDINKVPNGRTKIHIIVPMSGLRTSITHAEDVAVFIQPTVIKVDGFEQRIDFFLPYGELADSEWIAANLNPCEFAAFPGYPTGSDLLSDRPIVRLGTIASDPRTDYSHTHSFLGRRVAYEALSSAGSSGSPVIAPQRGFSAGAGITFNGHREGKIIGINAGHIHGANAQHSGISYFIKAQAIKDLLDQHASPA